MAIGVYQIRCVATGKVYVGSATLSIEKRWAGHRAKLRTGTHANRHLLAAWNKHGADCFAFTVLEECEPELCLAREQFWIDELRSADPAFGYNLRPRAENNSGLRFSDDSRKRVSDAMRGRRCSAETRQRISESARARGVRPEVLAKAQAATRGKPITEEHKAKVSAALRGRKHGPERTAKVSAALKGKGYGPEVRARMSAGQKGKHHSEATKAKMSATRKGRKYSESHRKAISEGLKRRRMSQLVASGLTAAPTIGEES